MIYLTGLQQIENDIYRVGVVHYQYEQIGKSIEELEKDGIFINNLPPLPTLQIGKSSELRVNKSTKDVWYEIIDRPLTQEEIIQVKLKQQEEEIAMLWYELMKVGE